MQLDHGVLVMDLLEMPLILLLTIVFQEMHKNRENNFSVLDEGLRDDINDRVGEPETKFSIDFEIKSKFCSSLQWRLKLFVHE